MGCVDDLLHTWRKFVELRVDSLPGSIVLTYAIFAIQRSVGFYQSSEAMLSADTLLEPPTPYPPASSPSSKLCLKFEQSF